MKKQPVLTYFPSHVFATARRKFQAGMCRLRESLADESLSGYAVMFADVLPAAFLKRIDPTRRNRHFGHIPVFRAWLAQVLEGNASCSKAIGFVQSWCRSQGLPVPSSDTSSCCKARCRLSDAFLGEVAQRVGESLVRGQQGTDLWHGFTLKAVDGTTVKLADTEEDQKRFPQPSGQKPGCGFPVMGIAGLPFRVGRQAAPPVAGQLSFWPARQARTRRVELGVVGDAAEVVRIRVARVHRKRLVATLGSMFASHPPWNPPSLPFPSVIRQAVG